MKKQQKLLALRKIQIAKITSFQITGGNEYSNSSIECSLRKSRTPSGNQTQTHTYAVECTTSDDI